MSPPLLAVQDLECSFATERGTLKAVDGVSLELHAGRTLALVGESGSGKSVTALSILGLLAAPAGRITGGKILYRDRDLRTLPEPELRKLRGDRISMIFQEPMTSLNPVYTIGAQIAEAVRLHRPVSRKEARARALEMLKLVGIPAAAERIDAYPHQLSGGMRQRVMIAMALACDPDVLIADEPTTALDVTIQATILELLQRLQHELGMAILFITHDLGVVAEFAHEVAVMYAGQIVERAPVEELFRSPLHPYTRGLLASVPPLDAATAPRRLRTIPGMVPDLRELQPGCRFRDRCARHEELLAAGSEVSRCAELPPAFLTEAGHGHRCHFPGVAHV